MPRSKGVPRHVRQNYHYFVFSANAAAENPGATGSDVGTTTESSASTSVSQRTLDIETGGDSGTSKAASVAGGGNVSSDATLAGVAVDDERRERIAHGGTVSSPEQEQEGQQRHEHPEQQLSKFAWASSTLPDCSVCWQGYSEGDSVCRLPCAHAFHAPVRPEHKNGFDIAVGCIVFPVALKI